MRLYIIFIGFLIFGCQTNENPTTTNVSINPQEKQKTDSINQASDFQNGDLIFQTSLSNQSMAIQLATNSVYSHMGIIYLDGEQTFVYEAVQPVKITPLKDWIKRGKEGHFVVKRLKQSDRILTNEGIAKMKSIGKKFQGKNYDLRFEWSDDNIYCSELVWKIYKEAFNIEIGALQQLKDFDLSAPEVQAKLKERYGNDIPMDEFVITPDRMFNANNLVTVLEK